MRNSRLLGSLSPGTRLSGVDTGSLVCPTAAKQGLSGMPPSLSSQAIERERTPVVVYIARRVRALLFERPEPDVDGAAHRSTSALASLWSSSGLTGDGTRDEVIIGPRVPMHPRRRRGCREGKDFLRTLLPMPQTG